MAVNIKDLTKDTSFNNDDYIMKDGSTNGTRLISVQNAADDLARKSTVGLKRPSAYDEATTVDGTDYIIKDDTSAPKRVTAQNAATSFAQLAQYDTSTSVSDQDYILKLGSDGVTKVEAEQAAADFAQLAGQVVGSEMVESAIAKGLADEALDRAIDTVVPNAVTQLKTELSEGTAATEIVNGAIESSELQSTFVERTDQLLKWDPSNNVFKRVTVNNVVSGSIARGTNRTSPANATDPVVMGSFLYNQDGSPNSASTYNVPLNKLISGLTSIDTGSTSSIAYGGTNASDQIAYWKKDEGVWYRTSVRNLLNLLHFGTIIATPSNYYTPSDGRYLLYSYNSPADGKNIGRITEGDFANNIANYIGEHIPFDKTNVDETTVDGQLRAALYNLGILDDVATDMLNLKKALTKVVDQLTVKSTSVTLNATYAYTSGDTIKLVKVGKVVTLTIGTLKALPNSTVGLGTIPEGYRPTKEEDVFIFEPSGTGVSKSARVVVNPNGAVTVYAYGDYSSAAIVNARTRITYICA